MTEGPSRDRTGADLLADSLRLQGLSTLFVISGNQNLPVIDALGRQGIAMVHARHETGAGYMAEGWARMKGSPGVYMVPAGPGLTSGITPLAVARQGETPLLMLSGSHRTDDRGKGAFQEIDQVGITKPICKAVFCADKAEDIPDVVHQAWVAAVASPPGPVHVALPYDVLLSKTSVSSGTSSGQDIKIRAEQRDIERFMDAWHSSQRAVFILRPSFGPPRLQEARRKLSAFGYVYVADSPRGLRDPGAPWLTQALQRADAVFVLAPLDFTVGFGELPTERVVAFPQADEAFLVSVLEQMERSPGAQARDGGRPSDDERDPRAETAGLRSHQWDETDEAIHPLGLCSAVMPYLRADDILVIDGGEFGQWMRYGFRDLPNDQLINGKFGAIGGSIPLAIGASTATKRRAIVFIGDGAFGYYSSELDTSVRCNSNVAVIVGSDCRWGSEWHLQQELWSGRTYTTELDYRNSGAVAAGWGAQDVTACSPSEIHEALARTLDYQGGPRTSCASIRIKSIVSPGNVKK